MINFTRAFDSAWERMHIILFRPFDFGKWCAIGLSAFLAGLLEGGNGFNYRSNYNVNTSQTGTDIDWQKIHDGIVNAFRQWQTGAYGLIIVAVFLLVIALALVFAWLGARGQFLFLDNIVRNRGAIAWPWSYYSRPANSLFFFHLVMIVISLAIFIPIFGVGVLMAVPLFQQDRWPAGGEIASFVALGLVYAALSLILSLVLFIFREFGVPLMFRHQALAWPSFRASMRLITQHPGSVVIFVLLRIALAIGMIIVSIIVCCGTCCIGALPYIGTVILLPVLVYVRCFTLDCLAQFGPEYDVWTVDVPPAGPLGILPITPPPQPG
jgi:hypothetical protein